MLQFIVLGYVPGTTIQLSFFEYLVLVGIACVLLWLAGLLLTFAVQLAYMRQLRRIFPFIKFRRRKTTYYTQLLVS